MPSTEISIKGYNRVANGLRASINYFEDDLDGDVRQWSQETRAELKKTKYPPRRPQQTYVRTGKLANSWGVRKRSKARYTITNSAAYSSYVVGDAQGRNQAWMHAGRWWKARTIIQGRAAILTERLTNKVTDLLKGDTR